MERLTHGGRRRTPSSAARAAATGSDRSFGYWLQFAITALWIAALLFVIAYVVIEGESALAQLDELDLVATYSLSP